jgi:hypothetical protein
MDRGKTGNRSPTRRNFPVRVVFTPDGRETILYYVWILTRFNALLEIDSFRHVLECWRGANKVICPSLRHI